MTLTNGKPRRWTRASARALSWGLALGLAAVAAVPAIAARKSRKVDELLGESDGLAPRPSISLLSLDFDPAAEATVVGITASGPVANHTAWQERRRDEDVVVVDLPGTDGTDLPAEAEVGTEEVRLVRTIVTTDKGAHTRLEVVRSPGPRVKVSVDPANPNRLLITVPSSPTSVSSPADAPAPAEPGVVLAAPEPAAEEAPAQAAVPPPEPAPRREPVASGASAEPMFVPSVRVEAAPRAAVTPGPVVTARPAANPESLARSTPALPAAAARPAAPAAASGKPVRLLDASVESTPDGRTLLRVTGTGPMVARAFTLDDAPRLVIDLENAITEVRRGVIPVRSDGVRRVRIRQNQGLPEPVTRIVVDLDALPVRHDIVNGPDSVLVTIGGGGAAPPLRMAASAPPAGTRANPNLLLPTTPVATSAALPPDGWAASVTTPASLADLGRPTGARTDGTPPSRWTGRPSQEPLREAAAASGTLVQSPTSTTTGGSYASSSQDLGGSEPVYTGAPITISVKDAELPNLLTLFAEYADLNIIIDPKVKGNITLKVEEVPWDQVMALVLKAHDLGSSQEGNVLRIAPLAKLAKEEQQKKALADAKELAGEVRSIARRLSYASGREAEQLVRKSISSRGAVQLDRRTNTLLIKDIVPRVEEIERMLDLLDVATKQVMIEARIVETTKDFSKSAGITWNFTYLADRAFGNSTGFSFPRSVAADYAVNLPVSSATGTLGLSFRNILNTFALDLAIQAAEQRGRARIISAPRVMVQNNEEAEIESGVQIPIVNTTATEIEVTYVSASLKLTVEPQITHDDTIIMDIQIENNQPVFIQTVGDNASIATRQASTVVAVPNGGTTVIGGIYQVNEGVSQGRVPFFSRIPILGWLFRNKSVDRTNDELIIFLTPTIQES